MLICDCYIAIFRTIASKWLIVNRNTWNHLTVSKNELSLVLKCSQQNVFTNQIYSIYMYEQYLALDTLQWLICHKTHSNKLNKKQWNNVIACKNDVSINLPNKGWHA